MPGRERRSAIPLIFPSRGQHPGYVVMRTKVLHLQDLEAEHGFVLAANVYTGANRARFCCIVYFQSRIEGSIHRA